MGWFRWWVSWASSSQGPSLLTIDALTVHAEQPEELAPVDHERQLVHRLELVGAIDLGELVDHHGVVLGGARLDYVLAPELLRLELLVLGELGHLPAVAASLRGEEGARRPKREAGRERAPEPLPERAALDDDQEEPEEDGVEDEHGELDVDAEPAGPEEGPLVEALVVADLPAAALGPQDAELVVNKWRVDVAAEQLEHLGRDVDANGPGGVQREQLLESNQQTDRGDESRGPDFCIGFGQVS